MKKILVLLLFLIVPDVSFAALDPFPGSYSVTVKGVLPTGAHFVKLAMYSFQPDGLMREDFWIWFSDSINSKANGKSLKTTQANTSQYGNTGKKVGYIFQNTYPYNLDENVYIQGLQNFNNDTPPLTLFGKWSRDGDKIKINWSWGDWEDWVLTWNDSSLYKIELYNSSYTSGEYYLKKGEDNGWKRDSSSAINGGWGFGAQGTGFNSGSTVSKAMEKNYSGHVLQFNSWACSNSQISYDEMNLSSFFLLTDNDVARFVSWDNGSASTWVFHYYAKPASNTDLSARKIIYHISHDFDNSGSIANDVGHTYSGLEIIDENGDMRGMVFAESSENNTGICASNPNTISSIYYVDSDFCDVTPGPDFVGPCN